MNEFKIGDRVRVKIPKSLGATFEYEDGTIDYIYEDGTYKVVFEPWGDDEEALSFVEASALTLLEAYKPTDPKTAFLTEMQELLEKYDMTIGTFEGCTVPTMPYGVMFGSRYQYGDDIYVFYDMPVISSDNIFDYEKE